MILEKLDTKKKVYSPLQNYKCWIERNINKEEHMSLEGLCSNKNIKVQKSDKDKLVVLVNKADNV